jgi:hypothetical protein
VRYSDLSKILENLTQYTTRHHKGTYGLIRKITDIDNRNTLLDLYKAVASIKRGMPSNVIEAVDKALDSVPENSASRESGAARVKEFIYTITRSCENHDFCEVEAFFELESPLFEAEGTELYDNLERVVDILEKSTDDRAVQGAEEQPSGEEEPFEQSDKEDGSPEKSAEELYDIDLGSFVDNLYNGEDIPGDGEYSDPRSKLVDRYGEELHEAIDKFTDDPDASQRVLFRFARRYAAAVRQMAADKPPDADEELIRDDYADSLGYQYLVNSNTIRAGRCRPRFKDPVFNLSRKVQSLYNLGRGNQVIMEFMDLFLRKVSPEKGELSKEEERQFREMLCSCSMQETQRLEYSCLERRSSKKQAKAIEDEEMKAQLKEDFGVEVTHIHDLTRSQFLLYLGRQAAQAYDEFARERIDPEFIRKVALKAHENHMLERMFNQSAGGCGPAHAEIMYHNEFLRLGYRVFLDLYDRSKEFLDMAVDNCFTENIHPFTYQKDLHTLSYPADLNKDRQVWLSLEGGTLHNFPNWIDFVKRVGGIFDERDLMEDGEYLLKRYDPNQERMPDIFMVSGDMEKDEALYRSLISKRFLSHGLSSGYQIPDRALMRDGRYMHTTYMDPEEKVLRCIFLLTQTVDRRFKENQAIRVIDSGIMDEVGYTGKMSDLGWNSHFIKGPGDRAVALSWRKTSEQQMELRRLEQEDYSAQKRGHKKRGRR